MRRLQGRFSERVCRHHANHCFVQTSQRWRTRRIALATAMILVNTSALAFDPLLSEQGLQASIPPEQVALDANDFLGNRDCPGKLVTATDQAISLTDTIRRALCRDPRTRQTWQEAKLQAARLGISRASYLPTLSAAADSTRGRQANTQSGLASSVDGVTNTRTLELAWRLFDFGQREAAIENAQASLLAALANRDLTLQKIVLDAANAFFALLNAQGKLAVAQEVERINLQSFLAAEAKHAAGVGDLTGKLQTQTAYGQAILNRVRAEGAVRQAQGQLAVSVGESPELPLRVEADDKHLPSLGFVSQIGDMLRLAEQEHPELQAAQARLTALKAKVSVTERAHLPTLSLNANRGSSSQSYSNGADKYTQDTNSVTFNLNVPLFDGFNRPYQTAAARAEYEQAAADLDAVKQKIALEVWQSFQTLQTETQALDSSEKLLGYATKSLEVAQGRYKAGIGSTLELLDAQRALADAAQQRIEILASWRATRLRLAASLGRLGFQQLGEK